ALLFQQRAGRPGADGRAPETAELDPPHGNPPELPGNQAAANLTGWSHPPAGSFTLRDGILPAFPLANGGALTMGLIYKLVGFDRDTEYPGLSFDTLGLTSSITCDASMPATCPAETSC